MTKLQKIAAVATIIAAVIAVLQYYHSHLFSFPSTTAPQLELPQVLKDQSSAIKLSLGKETYSQDKKWLLAMREAANKIPYYDKRRGALIKVVNASLNEADSAMSG